jgi:hypothetical protein
MAEHAALIVTLEARGGILGVMAGPAPIPVAPSEGHSPTPATAHRVDRADPASPEGGQEPARVATATATREPTKAATHLVGGATPQPSGRSEGGTALVPVADR